MTGQSHKEAAVEFLTLIGAGKVREAYDRHAGPGFRHHNQYFREDAASLMEAMERDAAKNPGKVLEVKLALQEGERVAVFAHVRQKPGDPGFALVHIFQFVGRRIAELWEVGQPVLEDSVNKSGMF